MFQTNTNTNNGFGSTNWNQIFGRNGQGQRGSSIRGCSNCGNDCRNNSIAKYLFEGEMKYGYIFKLTITETGHQATQYKKIVDTLPVLCTDKKYRGIDNVLYNGIDLVKADFTPT